MKTLEAIEKGSVAALILVECDPYRLFPDRARLEQALGKLDFLLVMDFLPSPSAQQADIFLPTQTLFEAGGSFVNQEGRVQWAEPVYRGGTPVEQLSAGGHPPRIFREDIPGGEPRPAGWILAELARLLSPGQDLSPKTLWSALAEENPIFSRLQNPKDSQDEIRLIPDQGHDPGEGGPFPMDGAGVPEKNTGPGDSLELLLVDRTFGTEEMSSYSSPLRETVEQSQSNPAGRGGGPVRIPEWGSGGYLPRWRPVGNSGGSPGTSGGGDHGPAAAGPTGLAKNSRPSGKGVSGSNKKKSGDPVTPDWILGYLFLLIKLGLVLIGLLSIRRLPDPGRTKTAGADAGPLWSQPGREVRTAPAVGRCHQDADQGRHRPPRGGPDHFSFGPGRRGGHGLAHFCRHPLWKGADLRGPACSPGDYRSPCGPSLCPGPFFDQRLWGGPGRMGLQFQIQPSGRHPGRGPDDQL